MNIITAIKYIQHNL